MAKQAKKQEDTEALAVQDTAALTTPSHTGPAVVEGLEGMDQGDLVIPRLQVMQPTSRPVADQEAPAGSFLNNLSGEFVESMTIIPLIIGNSRVWFEEGAEKPTCKSNDAMRPHGEIEKPPSQVCAATVNGKIKEVCPRAQWHNRQRPDCQLSYNLLALDAETKIPFIIQLKGTSVKPARRLKSYFALYAIHTYTQKCVMSLIRTKNSYGTFYVVNFSNFQPITPPDKYRNHYLRFRGYDVETTYKAEDAAKSGSAGNEGNAGSAAGAGDEDKIPF